MTQVFGTLGPACAKQETLEAMFRAGMTGMRLNLSHTGLAESSGLLQAFHAAAAAVGITPQLLIDMQGPELRTDGPAAPLTLREGETVPLSQAGIPLPAAVEPYLLPGQELMLDDGKLLVRVTKAANGCAPAAAEVLRGGVLKSRKSVKLPGIEIPLPLLTPHDIDNLKKASAYGVTALMQPFVRSGDDLAGVRALLREIGADVQIFAKIESMAGVRELDGILAQADVIVIARGDLGNDLPLWELPAVQKRIAAACRAAGRPFITVTQMLASMEKNPVPTRAEVSDIFNAVTDGSWGVMLTGETAAGSYPVEAITYMANTAREAEQWVAETPAL